MQGLVFRVMAVLVLTAGLSGCATPDNSVGSIPPMPGAIPVAPDTGLPLLADHALPVATAAAEVPPGYVSFCLRFADQCAAPVKEAPRSVALTPVLWDTLNKVNLATNESLWPEDDQQHYGRAEFWTIPTDGYGDCEDSALAKRKALIAAGLPEGALRVAVVLTPERTRHAVLSVVTDRGDYVLDNLNSRIRAWDRTEYTWIERQDPDQSTGWASLLPADRMLAATGASLTTGTTH